MRLIDPHQARKPSETAVISEIEGQHLRRAVFCVQTASRLRSPPCGGSSVVVWRPSHASTSSRATATGASWLQQHLDGVVVSADPVVRQALEIVGWDAYFIGAKVHRAFDGRDRFQHDDEDCDSDPVQNDWNGSAKVALISLERTEVAWRVIGDATGDNEASALADTAGTLRRTVLDEFPKAMSFIRPGFDEPDAAGATEVLIDNISEEHRATENGPYADTLIIRFGPDSRSRHTLEDICEEAITGEADGRVDSYRDEIRVWWD